MDRVGAYLLGKVQSNPILAIQWVLVAATIISVIYVFTPLYPIGVAIDPSPLSQVLSSPLLIRTWAGIGFIGAVLVAVGLVRKTPHLRSWGWFILFLVRLYQVFGTILITGPLPPQWIPFLTLALIFLIMWARSRVVDE